MEPVNNLIFDRKTRDMRDAWLQALSAYTNIGGLHRDLLPEPGALPSPQRIGFEVRGETYAALAKMTRGGQFLRYTTLLTAMQVCLAAHNGEREVVVGSPTRKDEGPRKETDNLVPIQGVVDPTHSAKACLMQTRSILLESYGRQAYPFSQLLRDLDQEKPLFDMVLAYEPVHDIPPHDESTLLLEISDGPNGLEGTLYFDGRIWREARLQQMLDSYLSIITNLVADPAAPVGTLTRPNDRMASNLGQWSTAPKGLPGACIHNHFGAIAADHPQALALSDEYDNKLTYGQLDVRANQMAHLLREHGAGPEVVVGLMAHRRLETMVAILGIWKAGATFLPLDPALPESRLEFMAKDSGMEILLASERPAYVDEVIPVIHPEQRGLNTHRPNSGVQLANAAYIIYTSGSTGQPKGVVVNHGEASAHLRSIAQTFGTTSSDKVLQFAAFSFDVSLEQLISPLLVGASVFLRGEDTWDLEQLIEIAETRQITVMNLPTAYWRQITHSSATMSRLGSLRLMIAGGDEMIGADIGRWQAGTNVQLINAYGPTEAIITATAYQIPRLRLDNLSAAMPIGQAVPHRRIFVLDAHGQPVAPGIAGELCIGGIHGLARGYLNRPGLSAAQFVPDPFTGAIGGRLYKTGDRVRFREDGQLEFLGRVDHQVKIRGFRIELGEIETALAAHVQVRDAVVTVVGDTDKRLAAYVIAEGDSINFKAHLEERLPRYMIPSFFTILDDFPKTPGGKVDRKALPEPVEPGNTRVKQGEGAPRTPHEQILADIWCRVLDRDQVSIHDHFMELGGDSILTLQVVSQAGSAGMKITVKQVFEYPTIAELAQVAEVVESTAVQEDVVGDVTISPIQRWFLDLNSPEPHHFNQAILLAAAEPLEFVPLRKAVARLLRHHDILRMRLLREEFTWFQEILPPDDQIPLRLVDLAHIPAEDRNEEMDRIANETQRSFSLDRMPLFQAVLFRGEETNEERLLLVAHHLVVDGVSWRILLEDLRNLYLGFARGHAPKLPPKTTSFKYWVKTTIKNLEQMEDQINYWTAEPEGIDLHIPYDFNHGVNDESAAEKFTWFLDTSITDQLITKVPGQWRVKVDELLLTALGRAINDAYGKTGLNNLRVDMESHGRVVFDEDVDLSRTVGWFTSMYPVNLPFSNDRGPADDLKAVKAAMRAVPENGVGYGMLRYFSENEDLIDTLAGQPSAQINFNYLGRFSEGGSDGFFRKASESRGDMYSPKTPRNWLINVDAYVVEGRMNVAITYSRRHLDDETIRQLSGDMEAQLIDLLSHCLTYPQEALSPADFPLAKLEDPQLESLLRQYPALEDVYGLTPTQQGMLYHTLKDEESGVYTQQLGCRLSGTLLEPDHFARAWQYVVDRHPVLRTALAWEGLDHPMQIVVSEAWLPFTYHDWSNLGQETQGIELEAYIDADRAQGVDLHSAPMLRLSLIRLADQQYFFLWTYHHLLLDGWSMPLCFQDFAQAFISLRDEGCVPNEPAVPYRDYIAWLSYRDQSEAKAFWQPMLTNQEAATRLHLDSGTANGPNGNLEHNQTLAKDDTQNLDQFARQNHVTMNTVVAGAWAIMLSHLSGDDAVTYGMVVSGRPAELPGAASIVGLFMNTLPLRFNVPGDQNITDWLADIQKSMTSLHDLQHVSLVDVHSWSSVPRGKPLFETVLDFANFSQANWRDAVTNGMGMEISDIRSVEQTNYPLTLTGTPGEQLALDVNYQVDRFREKDMVTMTQQLARLILAICGADSQTTPAQLRQQLVAWSQETHNAQKAARKKNAGSRLKSLKRRR